MKSKMKRVIAVLLSLSTVLTGCAPGLYADELNIDGNGTGFAIDVNTVSGGDSSEGVVSEGDVSGGDVSGSDALPAVGADIYIYPTEGGSISLHTEHGDIVVTLEGDGVSVESSDDTVEVSTSDKKAVLSGYMVGEAVDVHLQANEGYSTEGYLFMSQKGTLYEDNYVSPDEGRNECSGSLEVLDEDMYIWGYFSEKKNDFEWKMSDDEFYILENADKSLVGEGEVLVPADTLYVKQLIVNPYILPEMSFDCLFETDNDNDGTIDYENAILMQDGNFIVLYQVSADSEYYVGYASNAHNFGDTVVEEYQFARNNLDGEILYNDYYDQETGLVYIRKDQSLEEGTTRWVGANQVQLLLGLYNDGMKAEAELFELREREVKNAEYGIMTVASDSGEEEALVTKVNSLIDSLLIGGSEVVNEDPYGTEFLSFAMANSPYPSFKNMNDGAGGGGLVLDFGKDIENSSNASVEIPDIPYLENGFHQKDPSKKTEMGDTLYANAGKVEDFYYGITNGGGDISGWDLKPISDRNVNVTHKISLPAFTAKFGDLYVPFPAQTVYLECLHIGKKSNNGKTTTATLRILSATIEGEGPNRVYKLMLGIAIPTKYGQAGGGVFPLKISMPETGKVYIPVEAYKVTFSKVDGTTKEPLAGAQFEIRNSKGELMGIVTTGADGKGVSPALPDNDTYTAIEISAPEGYIASPDGINISKDQEEIEVPNKPKGPIVNVYKYEDSEPGTNVAIKGTAWLQILKDDGTGTIVASFDSSGTTEPVKTRLEPGNYILREYEAPDGYLLCPDVKFTVPEEFTSKTEINVAPLVDDYISAGFRKVSEDSPDTDLAGAHMQLWTSIGGVAIAQFAAWTTGEEDKFPDDDVRKVMKDGHEYWVVDRIPAGEYILREVESPAGYLPIEDTVITIEEKASKHGTTFQEFTAKDSSTRLSLLKTDQNGNPLAGAKLRLYYSNGSEEFSGHGAMIDEWISTKDAHTIKGVNQYDTYWLEEVEPPVGYSKIEPVKVNFGHVHTEDCFAYYDLPWVCGKHEYGKGGPGIKCAYPGCNAVADNSGYNNYCSLGDWDTGWAYTSIYDGYGDTVRDPKHVNGLTDSKGTHTDFEAGRDVDDLSSGTTELPGDVESAISSANPELYATLLSEGYGNALDGMCKVITGEGFNSHFFVGNAKGIHWDCGEFTKRYGMSVRDAILKMFATPKSADPGDGVDGGGRPCVCGYATAKKYYVNSKNEVLSKSEWVAKGSPSDYHETVMASVADTPERVATSVYVRKLDSVTGKPLAGAKLEVREGSTVKDSWTSDGTGEGWHKVNNLEQNHTYTLVETAPPDGYVMSGSGSQTFYVDENDSDKMIQIELKNVPTKVTINKLDKDTNAPLANATLAVYDSKNTEVLKFVTSNEVKVIEKLKAGTYTVKELTAPDGYMKSQDVTFTLDSSHSNVTVTMKDPKIRLTVYKFDSPDTNHYFTTTPPDMTGKSSVNGAKMALHKGSAAGEVVARWWTNSSEPGKVFDNLSYGHYTLVEEDPPEGYATMAQFGFDIPERATGDGDMGKFYLVCNDDHTRVNLLKRDSTDNSMMGGVTFSIFKAEGGDFDLLSFVKDVTTSAGGWLNIDYLPVGDYALLEKTVPAGYWNTVDAKIAGTPFHDKNGMIKLKVTESTITASPLEVEVLDDRYFAEFVINKVDPAGNPIQRVLGDAEFDFYEWSQAAGGYVISSNYEIYRKTDMVYTVRRKDGNTAYESANGMTYGALVWTPDNQGKFAVYEKKAPTGYMTEQEWCETIGRTKSDYKWYIDIINDDVENYVEHIEITADSTVELPDAHNWKIYYLTNPDKTLYPLPEGADMSKNLINMGGRGGIAVQKWNQESINYRSVNPTEENLAEGDTKLNNFVFKVINRSGYPIFYLPGGQDDWAHITWVNNNEEVPLVAGNWLVTDAEGYAGMLEKSLMVGTYEVIENTLGTGYLSTVNGGPQGTIKLKLDIEGDYVTLDFGTKATQTDKIQSDKKYFSDDVMRGGVTIQKWDTDKVDTLKDKKPQGDGTLQGTEYTIYNKSDRSIFYFDGSTYKEIPTDKTANTAANTVCTIVTDENGLAKTVETALPYGTYTIVETKSPTGYLIEEHNGAVNEVTFQIRTDGQIVHLNEYSEADPAVTSDDWFIEDDVIRGGVQIQKWDLEIDKSEAIGGKNHGAYVPDTGTHIEGIQFEIRNLSPEPVYVIGGSKNPDGGYWYMPKTSDYEGDLITTLTIAWNEKVHAYTAETPDDFLPYGTYEVKEVYTTPSYLLTDSTPKIFQIRVDKEIVKNDTSNTLMAFKDQVVRGDIRFVKREGGGSRGIKAPFIIQNVTTGEAHVIVTDLNGEYNSNAEASGLPAHSVRTNGYDEMDAQYVGSIVEGEFVKGSYSGEVDIIEEFNKNPDVAIDIQGIQQEVGLWFGLAEEGTIADVDDSLPALPYGMYILKEMRTTYNTGLDLKEFVFWVTSNGLIVNLGTILDHTDGEFHLESTAIDDATGTHSSRVGDKIEFTDTIYLSGLTRGDTYRVVGKIVDYASNEVVQNLDGMDVVTEQSFVAGQVDQHDGTVVSATAAIVRLSFMIDAEIYTSNRYVVFVDIYQDGVKLASDLTAGRGQDRYDIAETVLIPEITTALRDYYTGDQVGKSVSAGGSKLVDTVTFRNLAPYNEATHESKLEDLLNGEVDDRYWKQEYIMRGTIWDITEGSDEGHRKVAATAETRFTTEEYVGTVEVVFDFEAEDGHTYVVTEELCAPNRVSGAGKDPYVVLAEHSDFDEELQMAWFPGIQTRAIDPYTGNHVGNVADEVQKVVDTVWYENLIVGKTYTISGKLMVKDGYSTEGTPLMEDGHEITASITFEATQESGYVELTFNVKTSTLAGKTVVAFEDLVHNDVNVATHADISDEDQSVHYPEVKTTAVDGHTTDDVASSRVTYLVDTVKYSNLVMGETYKLVGTLIDKSTGEYFGKAEGIGTPKMAYATFTVGEEGTEDVDGFVKMIFQVEEDLIYAGKTGVIFEDLYLVKDGTEKIVRRHEDLDDADQTVFFPDLHTTAVADSGLKEQWAKGTQVIQDEVQFENLVVGREYTVTGKLYVQGTEEPLIVNGKEVTAEATFTAKAETETHTLTFTIEDASVLEGETVVAFEDLYHNNVQVAIHHDITDFKQSVKYPKVGTEALDADTLLDEGLAREHAELKDIVAYENLEDGATYTIKGTIYNRKTGEPQSFGGKYILAVTKFKASAIYGEVISTETKFVDTLDELNTELAGVTKSSTDEGTCKSEDVVSGTVEVAFTDFNALEVLGEKVVVFEYLLRDGVVVGSHEDIEDEDQEVGYPEMRTQAWDDDTQIQESNYGQVIITDTIKFKALTIGNKYVVKTSLVFEDGTPVLDSEGEQVVVTTEFTAEWEEGTLEIEIPLDASLLEGKTIVVFEDMYREGKKVSTHSDLEDKDQTLYFPEVHTNAKDSYTEYSDAFAGEGCILIDTVDYANLSKGESYYIEGVLMDKDTGKPVTVGGEEVTSSVKFVAGEGVVSEFSGDLARDGHVVANERVDGSVEVRFTFDASDLAGKDVVVFEKLYTWDGKLVGHHEDLEDEGQTIEYPKVETTMVDAITKDHESQATELDKYIDTVAYYNLKVGHQYTITGVLMDKDTGEELLVNGERVTASVTFTPDTPDGTVDVVYEFDSSALEGKDVVSFETLEREGKKVGAHEDIDDEDQTVAVINIHTTALDKKTELHEGIASKDTVVVDTVEYVNLFYPGEVYILRGSVIDKATGEALKISGTESYVVERQFTPDDRNGFVTLELPVDTEELEGKDVVVYERLYKNGKEIAVHTNLEDVNQTVYIPEIRTHAWDSETEDWEGLAWEDSVLVDTVSYWNLTKGEKYVAHAVVVDKETGEPIEGFEAYKSFIAGSTSLWTDVVDAVKDALGIKFYTRVDGEVEIAIPFDTTELAGRTVVVYEYLYRVDSKEEITEEKIVGKHEDLTDDDQTVHYPKIGTTMVDGDNGTHESQATEDDYYVDTVEYHNLRPGQTYTMTGTLMDKETGEALLVDGKEVTGSTTFVPTEPDGYVDVVYRFDSSLLEGHDIVSFEDLTRKGKKVGVHHDLEDENQTVAVENVHTTALSQKTNFHEHLAAPESVIEDVVEYVNLFYPGTEYELRGTLVDKVTGEVIEMSDGSTEVIKKFIADGRTGTVTLEFTVDTEDMDGKDLVVFETLYKDGIEIASHKDTEDESQTIYIPEIHTHAWDSVTGDHEAYANKDSVIVDTLDYFNLTEGELYVVHAVVHDKETGEAIEGYEAWKLFTAGAASGWEDETVAERADDVVFSERVDGFVEVPIPFDTTGLAGHDVVVFEYLYRVDSVEDVDEDLLVGVHEDIEDEGQTITFPWIGTTMGDIVGGGTHESQAKKLTKYIDVVEYKGLTPGREYTMKGVLMDKDTGEALLVDGKEVHGETTFTPEKSSGTVEVVYEFDSSILEGKDVVSFEECVRDEHTVASHTDIEDDNQTIAVVNIHTVAHDNLTNLHESLASGTTKLVDVVEYVNLIVGHQYRVSGTLVNKDTGKALEIEGATAHTDFVAETRNGYVNVEFNLDTSLLAGMRIVMFEVLSVLDVTTGESVEAVFDTDVENANQSIYIPEVGTKAIDAVTKTHEGLAGEETVIVDTVAYGNVTYGETYVVKGILYSKTTGKPIEVDGKPVEASLKFVATENGFEPVDGIQSDVRYSGEVEIEFTFDSSAYAGDDIVVFEYLYASHDEEDTPDEDLIAKHDDIEDEDQTVSYPKIGTTLTGNGGAKDVEEGNITLTDRVAYENLEVGKTYEVVGTLLDKETGKSLEITAKAEFVPEKPEGYVDIEFKFDASKFVDKSLVAFERVFNAEGVLVAKHEDIEDEDQTVKIHKHPDDIKIGTTATNKSDGSHVMSLGKQVGLVDTVWYKHLGTNTQYKMYGKVIDKATGEVITDGYTIFKTEDNNDGTVTVEFVLNTEELQGRDLVCYEYLALHWYSEYEGKEVDLWVASHEDINDENQTVHVPEKSSLIETGDFSWLVVLMALMLMSAGVVMLVASERKKKF